MSYEKIINSNFLDDKKFTRRKIARTEFVAEELVNYKRLRIVRLIEIDVLNDNNCWRVLEDRGLLRVISWKIKKKKLTRKEIEDRKLEFRLCDRAIG